MIEPAHVSIGISMLAVFLVVAQVFIGRGDKSGGEIKEVAKQVNELALQIANLRTELAQNGAKQAEDMRRAFVSREEHDIHRGVVEFVEELTLEIHQRLHPDAAIHQPGGRAARR